MTKRFVLILMIFSLISTVTFPDEKCLKEEILKPEAWMANYKNYSCDPSIVELLKEKIMNADSIDIYFGFWCSDSRNNLPKFISLIDKINPAKLNMNYYKVGRKEKGKKFYKKALKIERVPTFIVKKNGKEIGRIIENPVKSLCEDLLNIIF